MSLNSRLAEEVAPVNFSIGNRSMGASLPIIKELERNHPTVSHIEDPPAKADIDGCISQ